VKWPAGQDDLDRMTVIALGSNLAGLYDSREALLEVALAALPGLGIMVRARSSWWRSAAWPDPTRPEYLNGIALVETDADPRVLLERLMGLERAFGRRRDQINANRTLDLDLIASGRMRLDEPGLVVPHPKAAERRFVMGPLAEIAPNWRHPLSGQTAETLAVQASVGKDARPAFPDRAALHKGAGNAI
jgi:2-amino-4-hydroxy-6-hydroxymethyldihydropteridine diphosphokinase